MRAGDGTLAAWHDGIERLFREREPVFGRLCRFDRWSGTGIPLAGMTAFPGLCDRTLYGQADAGQVGSKVVQVKGVMPLIRGLTRETPTGRAVGGFVVWHNFFEDLEEVMPVFIVFKD